MKNLMLTLLLLLVSPTGAQFANADQSGVAGKRWVDYAAPPATLAEFAAKTDVIVRGRVAVVTFVENPVFHDITQYRVQVLEVLMGKNVVEGQTILAHRIGGMREGKRADDDNFPEEFSQGDELVLFLKSNGALPEGYLLAYGPHGAYRIRGDRAAPYGKSMLGEAQRGKTSKAFSQEIRNASAK